MARWVNVLRKTFDHLSEMVNYVMRAEQVGAPQIPKLDDDYKNRVDVIINHWAQRKRGTISSIYREGGMRYIEIAGDKGKRCQIAVDPIDPRVKEFGVHVTDMRSRRKDFSVAIEDLHRKLDEAYNTAQRWLNE